jgi:hypothetical protein
MEHQINKLKKKKSKYQGKKKKKRVEEEKSLENTVHPQIISLYINNDLLFY